jgi:hypothetical protein
LKEQNWFAVALELFVVVLGIFLAFQVDRWYEHKSLLANEQQNLRSLAADFADNRSSVEWVIERNSLAANAGRELLALSESANPTVSKSRFYELLADAQRRGTLRLNRRTYDSLVSSGSLDSIQSSELKDKIAEFYANAERQLSIESRWVLELAAVWNPFIVKNTDHSALVMAAHPDRVEGIVPSRASNDHEALLGTDEFEGIVVMRWHYAADKVFGFEELLLQIESIEESIEAELRRSD